MFRILGALRVIRIIRILGILGALRIYKKIRKDISVWKNPSCFFLCVIWLRCPPYCVAFPVISPSKVYLYGFVLLPLRSDISKVNVILPWLSVPPVTYFILFVEL